MNTRLFRKRIRDSITKDVRFAERSVPNNIGEGCVLIVGQNPGHQRKNERTCVVWEGNRSADLLNWVLEGRTGLYFTNVCNYQEMTPERIVEGISDLKILINDLRPRKIICLGEIAYKTVTSLHTTMVIHPVGIMNLHKLHHPSYIARFNKDRDEYKRLFLSLIK